MCRDTRRRCHRPSHLSVRLIAMEAISSTNVAGDSTTTFTFVTDLLAANYGLVQVGVVALSILLYLPISKYLNLSSYARRTRWHAAARGVIFLIFSISFIPYSFLSASYTAETLAFASILVTLFASIIQPLYTPFDDRMKIHVAIPSLRPFNNAIRSGLYQKLSESNQKYAISDDRSSLPNYEENHLRLNDLAYTAVRDRADFLIAHPATEAAANDPIFIGNLAKLLKNGRHIFLIENFPAESSGLYASGDTSRKGRLIRVQSDSRSGASVLASFVRQEHAKSFEDGSAYVVLMSGPQESRNAKERRDVLADAFADSSSFFETPSIWWGVSSGRQTMLKILGDIPTSDIPLDIIILAGNDDMALGACSAITTQPAPLSHSITVYGYDGILPARYAIGQNTTPFAATVHIAPEEYGHRIGETLLSIASGEIDAKDILIPITSSKIKNRARCADELGLA